MPGFGKLLVTLLLLIVLQESRCHSHTDILQDLNEGVASVELLKRSTSLREDEFEVLFRVVGALGIQFKADLTIMAFRELGGGRLGAAEKSGLLHIGDKLMAVNGDDVSELTTADAFQVLNEAAENVQVPRRFVFRRGERGPGQRELSEEGRLAAHPDMVIEHIDVIDAQHQEHTMRIMMAADGFGVKPNDCTPRRLVFMQPEDACDENALITPPKQIFGAYAVVKRGKCSFHRKANVMGNLGAAGLLILNSEDRLFRMEQDTFVSDEINIPIAMLSSLDGEELQALRTQMAVNLNRDLQAKIVATQDCQALEQQEQAIALAKKLGQKSFFRSKGALEAEDGNIVLGHRLFGALSPAGTIAAVNSTIGSIDFVSASYSAPLPVGQNLELSMRPGVGDCLLMAAEDSDDAQYRRILQMQRRSERFVKCIIVVSKNSGITRLAADLPSDNRAAVIMVSSGGGRYLQSLLAQQSKITLEPSHSVWHRWNELYAMENSAQWPSTPKARRRLAARMVAHSKDSACRLAHLVAQFPDATEALASLTR